jgi:hypothetical protein
VPINFFANIQILGLKRPGSLNSLIPISICIPQDIFGGNKSSPWFSHARNACFSCWDCTSIVYFCCIYKYLLLIIVV